MTNRSQRHFSGVSGEYHVASVLAYRQLHVGLVHQGGEFIDLLVSTPDGSRSTTVQVKSRDNARRIRKRDGIVTGYDWYCGMPVLSKDPTLIYTFVDLKEWKNGLPDIYIVRAGYLQEHFGRLISEDPDKDWENDPYIFQPKPEQIEPYRNNWTPLWEDLRGESRTTLTH